MKVVAYSDAHRGITVNYDKIMQFGEFVKNTKPDLVIGCGDNYTLDWIPWVEIISFQPSGRTIAQQIEIAEDIPWIEMLGNHNMRLEDYAADLSPVQVSPLETLEIDGVYYTHGSQFDPTIKYWWNPLERVFWKWMPWLYPRLFGTPSVLRKSGRDISYSRLVGTVEANAQLWAESCNPRKSLVFGHTHSEFIKFRDDHFIANCGDFVDSCTCIIVTDGAPEIKKF